MLPRLLHQLQAATSVRSVTDEATRDEVLRLAWHGIRGWTAENVVDVPVGLRVVEAGADPDDVARAMSAAAYEAVFNLLSVLDEGADPESDSEAAAWSVVTVPDGKPLDGLHEDVLAADPTGQEGSDLFE